MNKAHSRLSTDWGQFLWELAGEMLLRFIATVVLIAVLLFGVPLLLVDGVEASPVYQKAEEMMSPPQYPTGCGQEQPDDHYASWEDTRPRYYLRI